MDLHDARPSDTSMNPMVNLDNEGGELLHDPKKYRQLVGKLNYLTITRPDIVFAMSMGCHVRDQVWLWNSSSFYDCHARYRVSCAHWEGYGATVELRLRSWKTVPGGFKAVARCSSFSGQKVRKNASIHLRFELLIDLERLWW
ncbi:hypothetical protein AKJ16_DCAP05882 [Drosera capensis]